MATMYLRIRTGKKRFQVALDGITPCWAPPPPPAPPKDPWKFTTDLLLGTLLSNGYSFRPPPEVTNQTCFWLVDVELADPKTPVGRVDYLMFNEASTTSPGPALPATGPDLWAGCIASVVLGDRYMTTRGEQMSKPFKKGTDEWSRLHNEAIRLLTTRWAEGTHSRTFTHHVPSIPYPSYVSTRKRFTFPVTMRWSPLAGDPLQKGNP